MIAIPLAFAVVVIGLYFPIGIGAYWYGWRCADRFWKGRIAEENDRAARFRDEYRARHPEVFATWGKHEIDARARPQPVADYLTRGHHAALGMGREPKA